MSFSDTPRSRRYVTCVTPNPMNHRPRPNVWERCPKIGPALVEVCTGTPPRNSNVVPPDDELTGVFDTLDPIAEVRNEMTVPPEVSSAGMKWSP